MVNELADTNVIDEDKSDISSDDNSRYSSLYNNDDVFYSKTGGSDLTIFKKLLIQEKGPFCEECGQTDVPLQVDHIVPVSRGGEDTLDNMQLLCYECHMKKHHYYFDEFGSHSNRVVPEKQKMILWAYHNQKKIKIKYRSFSGDVSERVIKPITKIYYEKSGKHGGYYVRAYCFLRNEERVFKVSRIESIVDCDD